VSAFALIAERDLDWVSGVIDVVAQTVDRPWRDALDRLDDLQRAAQPNAPRRFAAVVGAIQRLAGGRTQHIRAAREARSLVLGHPVFSAIERQARIGWAAEQLATTPTVVESMLWADLPRERPVELPYGRPTELEVAAFANVALIQRALRRAQSVTLHVSGDAAPILRAAKLRGLLVTATTCPPTGSSRLDRASPTHVGADVASPDLRSPPHVEADLASEPVTLDMTIEIVGPIALFHRTNVYGRALADLAPMLGELRDFALDVHVETPTALYSTRVESPVLLPAPPTRLAGVPYPIARLARELARAAPELQLTPTPPLIVAGGEVACPDLLVERGERRCYVEIVGFWTAEHVRRKLAVYRAASVSIIVCLDASGACGDDEQPAEAVLFRKHVAALEIVRRLDAEWG
jgi:predicted nuclease of restriction endonuclease-like RecB superfamily